MLRKTRIYLGIISLIFLSLLFVDFTGALHSWLGWMAKIQFFPAVLALNFLVIAFLLLLTFIAGRIYCSVICPLGIFQDVIARLGRRKKKLPYNYSKPKKWLRYSILITFILALITGFHAWVSLLDPYSAYGRIASNLFQPVWMFGNNLLASVAEHFNSYTFYHTDVWLKSLPTFIVAVAMLVAVIVLAWRNGRTYCNTICPVGTLLGLVSRFALFRITIDKSKCNHCTLCTRLCKSACIDPAVSEVDLSRCVVCLDCINQCKHHAISYRFAYGKSAINNKTISPNGAGKQRREFLTGYLLLLGSAVQAQAIKKAEKIKMDGGLAEIIDKQAPKRQTRITPPGSLSARHMQQHCTACQLCVSVCPNHVLIPSSNLETFMQPALSYERGYCRPECTKCSEVCPTGAIQKIDKAEKSSVHIGHAVWIKERCIPLTDHQSCGNCARHCPVQAITMIPSEPGNPDSLQIPAIDTERCIGCGACENLCPSRPLSAIYVEGHECHRIN